MMLRGVVLAFGLVLLGWGCIASIANGGPTEVGLIIAGALIVIGTIFERSYNALTASSPGEGFEPTGEINIDPVTGKRTETWFNPQTGARRYLAR